MTQPDRTGTQEELREMSTGDNDDPVDPEWQAMKQRERHLQGRLEALHLSVTDAIQDINDALEILDKTLRELKASAHLHGPKNRK